MNIILTIGDFSLIAVKGVYIVFFCIMVKLLDLFLLGIQQLSKKNIAKLNLYWKKFHTTNTTGSFVWI